MQTQKDTIASDAELVDAARRGEIDRYGELVQRYERRAYAVAWSRLGDPHLAEEAAQEAFIRGYRRLWLLADGAKFASWILSIVRNTAINLGIRHRRELEKRNRWVLEQATGAHQAGESQPEICSPENLRQTLSELPEGHRECLVLFYIEGRSGAESAAALRISEAAFRVRLHRARAALRERIEEKLGESLEQLRPSKPIAPIVVTGLLLAPSAKAASGSIAAAVGAKVASGIGKMFSLSWLVPLLPLLAALPGILLARFVGRLENRNFRDPKGFRARLHSDFFRSVIWGIPLLLLLVLLITRIPGAVGGLEAGHAALLAFLLFCLLPVARLLLINRSRFAVGTALYCVVLTVGSMANVLGLIPPQAHFLPFIAATVLYAFILKDRPARMDYSLLLRAAQNLLEPKASEGTRPLIADRRSLLAFARFLGERWLVSGYRSSRHGLILHLPLVRGSLVRNVFGALGLTSGMSRMVLGMDGSVAVHCSSSDAKVLRELCTEKGSTPQELERLVAASVASAWHDFINERFGAAERALGETSERDVFVVPPRRASSTRWVRGWMLASALLLCVLAGFNWKAERLSMVSGRHLKTVFLTEGEVRTALVRLSETTDAEDMRMFLQPFAGCVVLPSTDFFSAEHRVRVRTSVLAAVFAEVPAQPSHFLGNTPAMKAFVNGWLDLEDAGLSPAGIRDAIEKATARQRELWLTPGSMRVQSHDGSTSSFMALHMSDLPWRVQCLKRLGLVGLVGDELEETVGLLLKNQVLSNPIPAGFRQDVDVRLLHGMFLTMGQDPLQDTWQVLVVLDAAGALDRIDRQACIAGILRFHHNKGLFGSVRKGDGLVIFGDTRDTFYAFESLRMLGALDQVKDLDHWRFRPGLRSTDEIDWFQVEAWVCEQRLARIVRERKENPSAPVRSLLEP